MEELFVLAGELHQVHVLVFAEVVGARSGIKLLLIRLRFWNNELGSKLLK